MGDGIVPRFEHHAGSFARSLDRHGVDRLAIDAPSLDDRRWSLHLCCRFDDRCSARSAHQFPVLCIGRLGSQRVGCILLAVAPQLAPERFFLHVSPNDWYLVLIGLLILPLAKRAYYSIRDPGARNVQMAVKQAIMTIILLDAAATLQYAGPYWGSACCLLILPSLWLGSYFRST